MTDQVGKIEMIAEPDRRTPNRRRLWFLIPIAAFVGIAVAFAIGLTLDPRKLPSMLIGKSVPEFDLPAVQGRQKGLATKDLKGNVSLVNVFASWCVECRAEHPLLMELSKSGPVPIHGLNYRDQPADAAEWLDNLGDPYDRTGADLSGRVAIDWGVYGVPETFLVDRDGKVVYKHIGALSRKQFDEKLLPLINKLIGEGR